jgi:hypothetical protein
VVQSKPGQIVHKTLSQKTITKKSWWGAQGVGPEIKPQYTQTHKKKKKEEEEESLTGN